MKIKFITFSIFFCFMVSFIHAQSIKGTIIDNETDLPLKDVQLSIKGLTKLHRTNDEGEFEIKEVPVGNHVLIINYDDYLNQNIPFAIKADNESLDFGIIVLERNVEDDNDLSVITLTEDDLDENGSGGTENISGLLQSSRDAFLQAAAFNVGQARFRVRGYDSNQGTVLINGIEMNKLYDGRPQWNNWGGLNDVFRNQTYINGLQPSSQIFGGVLGVSSFDTRASSYRKQVRLSASSSNSNYVGRAMATYSTGMQSNGWALAVLGSRRFAEEGYFEGSYYDAWSAFIAIEKRISDNHSLNLTAFMAKNKRGKSSPNTQEVYDLKGYQYNSYWGEQDGENRNSRYRDINEPTFILSHYWDLSETSSLNTNVAYQFGYIANSRLGNFNADNPDPTYYKKLPSYYLRDENNPDYANAYLAYENFTNDGQVDWNELYEVNLNRYDLNGNPLENSLYYLYEDRTEDNLFSASSIFNSSITEDIILDAGVRYKNLTSNNFAEMVDLLGGSYFLDYDQFAEGNKKQSDLNNPDRKIYIGDKFNYNYELTASTLNTFAQFQFQYNKVDFNISGSYTNTSYQRDGLYKNGTFENISFGKGEKQTFNDFGVKAGATLKLTGRHLVLVNAGYLTQAPYIRNTFANVRVNNTIIPNVDSEKIMTGDLSYIFRAPKFKGRLTGYYTKYQDAIETSFFFAQGLRGDDSDFVSEMLTGVDKKHMGLELSLEYDVTSTIKIKGAAAVGQYTYDNNPNLYLQSSSAEPLVDYGKSYLKDYRLSNGPQNAFSLGFEYRDPDYWWVGANANIISNNYLDVAPILRTENFFLDSEGLPFNDIDLDEAKELLRQEKFDTAFLVNLQGGKSWKINQYYVGVFASINNVLGELYKSGGFEQSRNANYQRLKEDKSRQTPLFGPKYWYGYDTTYFLNVYVRF
ncbi:TonB-dependent receptor [Aureivirga marina]|uniref:TonB-dependent receptor n=1 Tax=Aureivirga marina TaxID=1182451 RepID=UPI0018C98330|nr:TonB-dependent receptor [Aureivirga marina]